MIFIFVDTNDVFIWGVGLGKLAKLFLLFFPHSFSL